MEIKEYVVCGPGRCGGHLMLGLLLAAGVNAVRTHDRYYTNGDDAHTVWVDLDRIEIFDAVCSNIIANRTGQTTHYDRTELPRFYVGIDEFRLLYQQHLDYRQDQIDRSRFARHDHFWYEHFAMNWQVVWGRLGLTPDPELLKTDHIRSLIEQPAPYNYRDIIINHRDLREYIIY